MANRDRTSRDWKSGDLIKGAITGALTVVAAALWAAAILMHPYGIFGVIGALAASVTIVSALIIVGHWAIRRGDAERRAILGGVTGLRAAVKHQGHDVGVDLGRVAAEVESINARLDLELAAIRRHLTALTHSQGDGENTDDVRAALERLAHSNSTTLRVVRSDR